MSEQSFIKLIGSRRVQFALLLRLAVLLFLPEYVQFCLQSPLINNTQSSSSALRETSFLLGNGLSPFQLYTHYQPFLLPMPLLVVCFSFFNGLTSGSRLAFKALFLGLELLIAGALYSLAEEPERKRTVDADDSSNRGALTSASLTKDEVAVAYLYNPYSAMAALGENLALLTGGTVLWALALGKRGKTVSASLLLAIAVYLDPFCLAYTLPLLASMPANRRLRLLGLLAVFGSCLLGGSVAFAGGGLGSSLSLIASFYLPRLSCSDARPNGGLWWYTFTLLFPQFRMLLLWTVNLVQVSFWAPASMKFWSDPLFLAFVLSATQTVLKAYPSASDWSLTLGLGLLNSRLIPECRLPMLLIVVFAQPVIAALSMRIWSYWIEWNGVNANFFYIFTLVGCLTWVLLALELMAAWSRRRVAILNPKLQLARQSEDGKKIGLLQR
jgi:hypothetical protein